MYAVIFEAEIVEGKKAEYLKIVEKLKTKIESMPGFISVERFVSLSTKGKIISISYWETQKDLLAWKDTLINTTEKKESETKDSKPSLIKDYRIRIAEIKNDYF